MKKLVSAVLSAAVAVSAALPLSNVTSAADDIKNITVLGDSISSGYGLSESEHNYGELVGNYYGAKTDNFAQSGDETSDLISKLESPTDELSASIKDADYVIVSIGGNDIIHYASNYLLTVCANIGGFKEGYTKADIPASPTFSDISRLVDVDAVKEYASTTAGQIRLNSSLRSLDGHLSFKKSENPQYDCVIEKKVIPNIQKINADIKALNPDATVVYQNIYDPLQFEAEYYNATYTGNALKVMNLLKPVAVSVTESFRDQLAEADLGGALISDIYTDFTSLDANGAKYSWYFTKMQEDRANMDFHPTQAGQVAIAAKTIDTIGTKDKGGDLIKQTYESLANKSSYPAVAYATYKKVADTTAPEETTITTTPTTTTATTTTTTTATTTATTSTTTTTTTTTPVTKKIAFGDPNNDGNIDAKDASFILTAYAKSSTGGDSGLSAEQKEAANVNKDALVDAKDASMILGYYAYTSTGGTKTITEYLAQ